MTTLVRRLVSEMGVAGRKEDDGDDDESSSALLLLLLLPLEKLESEIAHDNFSTSIGGGGSLSFWRSSASSSLFAKSKKILSLFVVSLEVLLLFVVCFFLSNLEEIKEST